MSTRPATVEDVYMLHAVPAWLLVIFFVVCLSVIALRMEDHSGDFFDAAMIEEDQRQADISAACAEKAHALCGGENSAYRPGPNGTTQCMDKHGRRTITLERVG